MLSKAPRSLRLSSDKISSVFSSASNTTSRSSPSSGSSTAYDESEDLPETERLYEKVLDHEPYKDDLEEDWHPSQPRRTDRRYNALQLILASIFSALLVGVCSVAYFRGRDLLQHSSGSLGQWTLPRSKPDFPIVASVFYGRRRNVEILNCYLQKNLVKNGGWLDSVQFMTNTADKADNEYLDELLASEPLYSKVDTSSNGWDFHKAWQAMTNNDTMYIKIDDDVLFIDDKAIPELVHSLMMRPDAIAIGANTINEPDTTFLGYHYGAHLPFLPEPEDAETRHSHTDSNTSWRPSELPTFAQHDLVVLPDEYNLSAGPPPGESHRWLPLPNTYANLQKTPLARLAYHEKHHGDAEQDGYLEWSAAAQVHMSFFSNVETAPEGLKAYHFGAQPSGIWDIHRTRYRVNFLAIWGSTVSESELPRRYGDDEILLTVYMPKTTGRHFLVQTRSLVSHFSFSRQSGGMEKTDIRERYKALAEERACSSGNDFGESSIGSGSGENGGEVKAKSGSGNTAPYGSNGETDVVEKAAEKVEAEHDDNHKEKDHKDEKHGEEQQHQKEEPHKNEKPDKDKPRDQKQEKGHPGDEPQKHAQQNDDNKKQEPGKDRKRQVNNQIKEEKSFEQRGKGKGP